MSDAAMKAFQQVMRLPFQERQWVAKQIEVNEWEADESFTMADVPQDIIDAELAIVEERMAADELNPLPKRPMEEAMADIIARFEQRQASK